MYIHHYKFIKIWCRIKSSDTTVPIDEFFLNIYTSWRLADIMLCDRSWILRYCRVSVYASTVHVFTSALKGSLVCCVVFFVRHFAKFLERHHGPEEIMLKEQWWFFRALEGIVNVPINFNGENRFEIRFI